MGYSAPLFAACDMLGHIVRMGIDEFLPFMLFQARFLINSYDDESCSYFYTFLFPSTALMPMEYCMPLIIAMSSFNSSEITPMCHYVRGPHITLEFGIFSSQ